MIQFGEEASEEDCSTQQSTICFSHCQKQL